MDWAVMFFYSDDDSAVYLFNSEETAKAFLYDQYMAELSVVNKCDTEHEISPSHQSFKIQDGDDVIECRIGRVYT